MFGFEPALPEQHVKLELGTKVVVPAAAVAEAEADDVATSTYVATVATSDEPAPEVVLAVAADVKAEETVAWADRAAYIKAAEQLRLHEFDTACAAIKAGMAEVCPAVLLPLLTWRELEARVCGAPKIDLELLKSITKYDGQYRREGDKHPVIGRFWQVMATLSEAEKSAVIAFSWGRSRLPTSSAGMGLVCFNIDDMDGGDTFVPTSSTCDFRLHLPTYSSEAILKEKLLYAVSLPAARKAVAVARAIEYGSGADGEPTMAETGDSGAETHHGIATDASGRGGEATAVMPGVGISAPPGLHYIDLTTPPTHVDDTAALAQQDGTAAQGSPIRIESSDEGDMRSSDEEDEHSTTTESRSMTSESYSIELYNSDSDGQSIGIYESMGSTNSDESDNDGDLDLDLWED
eukprot:SAG22_NODE_2171_length_2894_cov_1.655814_2_plen_406_part_00